jgi:formate dehydrogenase major subunit
MGAIPNKLPGFQDIEEDAEARTRIGDRWGVTIQPTRGRNLTEMLHAMSRRELTALPSARTRRVRRRPRDRRVTGLDHLVVVFTRPPSAHVCCRPRFLLRGRAPSNAR